MPLIRYFMGLAPSGRPVPRYDAGRPSSRPVTSEAASKIISS